MDRILRSEPLDLSLIGSHSVRVDTYGWVRLNWKLETVMYGPTRKIIYFVFLLLTSYSIKGRRWKVQTPHPHEPCSAFQLSTMLIKLTWWIALVYNIFFGIFYEKKLINFLGIIFRSILLKKKKNLIFLTIFYIFYQSCIKIFLK